MQKPGELKKPLQLGTLRKDGHRNILVCPCWDCTMARAERGLVPKLPAVTAEDVKRCKEEPGR